MRHGKYQNYYRPLILEFLSSRTGRRKQVSREKLKAFCKIPQGSLLEIIGVLERDGLVTQQLWFDRPKFRREMSVKLTQRGQIDFVRLKRHARVSGLPQTVSHYLNTLPGISDDLWPLQKEFVKRGFLTRPRNVSVFAYPATGKTLIAEMAIVKEVSLGGRALYCTPYKSLDWEKHNEFKKRFRRLRFRVAVSDGDQYVPPLKLSSADVIIATFERVSSAISNDEGWLRGISLVCVDEISLLADEDRGGNLDWLLTFFRMRRPKTWIVTLGPPIKNAERIADCLQAEPLVYDQPQMPSKKFLVYSSRDRGLIISERGGESRQIKTKKSPLEYLISQARSSDQKSLVFYESRRLSEQLSKILAQEQPSDTILRKETNERFPKSEDTQTIRTLRPLLARRVAFHHSGVPRRMKRFVEDLLRDGKLDVVVATTTLSHGVDFKIDNVIIDMRIILRVRPGLPAYEFVNLIGRAGRPGKSREGNAYLLVEDGQEASIFKRFFLGRLDPLIPSNPFNEESLTWIILSLAKRGNLRISNLNEWLGQTLYARIVNSDLSKVSELIGWLVRNGYLEWKDNIITLTRGGQLSLAKGLSPRDINRTRKIELPVQKEELLDLAIRISLGRRTRSGDLRSIHLAKKVLSDLVARESLDDIMDKRSRGNLFEADIQQLGNHAAYSLTKARYFLNPRVRPLVSNLVELLRR